MSSQEWGENNLEGHNLDHQMRGRRLKEKCIDSALVQEC